LPATRNPAGQPLDPLVHASQEVLFGNEASYSTYRVQFTNVKNNAAANSVQIAEIELLGRTGTATAGPRLSITRNNDGSVTITSNGPGRLQSTTSLTTPNWVDEGAINGSVTVPTTGQMRFFRVIAQ
jgi:hypothetical protein